MLVNLGWVDLNEDKYVSQFKLSRPKWSILDNTPPCNLRQIIKCYFLLVLYNFPVVFISFLDS